MPPRRASQQRMPTCSLQVNPKCHTGQSCMRIMQK
jgi:hypothetical protein